MFNSLISGGYSMGKGMDTFQKVGTVVGSAIGGPIVGAIIGAAAGALNRIFGRKLKDSGIQGEFGGTRGFEGESYEYYKGGLLRSDKTKTNPLAEDARKVLGDAFNLMRIQVGTFATSLGLNTDKIADFTTTIKVSTKGLSDADAEKAIQEALATANNELAEQVIGTWTTTSREVTRQISTGLTEMEAGAASFRTVTETVQESTYTASEYAKTGEKAIDTLTRLATSMSAVNGMWDSLGYTMMEAGLKGADAASKIVDAFGGLEAYSQTLGKYFDNFYSDAEKKSAVARQAAKALGDAGLTIDPSLLENLSRPVIRGFVESIKKDFGDASPEFVAATGVANLLATITEPQNLPVIAPTDTGTTAADPLQKYYDDRKSLEIELATVMGDTGKAYELITAGMSTAEKDAYDFNEGLRAQIRYQTSLNTLREESATLGIDLLRAQGREEEALAAERTKAIEGYDAYQVALYDSNQALRSQIDTLRELGEMLPSVIDQYLTPEQRTANAYSGIASDLVGAGLSGADVGSLAGALESMSKDQIATAAVEIYNMAGVTDDMRLSLVRAVGGLADLKNAAIDAGKAAADAAEATAKAAADAAEAERQRIAQERLGLERTLLQMLGDTSELRRRELAALDASNRSLQLHIYAVQDATKATDDAYSALEGSISKKRTAAQEIATEVGALFEYMRDQAKSLRQEIDTTRKMSAAQGNSLIQNALSNVRATGYLPELDDLRGAVDSVRAAIEAGAYSTQFEADRDRLVLAGQLQELADAAEPQLTIAEQQLKVMDDMLTAAKEQIDVLRGLKKYIVDDPQAAAQALQDAIQKEKDVRAEAAEAINYGDYSNPIDRRETILTEDQLTQVGRHLGSGKDYLLTQGADYLENLYFNGLVPALEKGYDPANSDMIQHLKGRDSYDDVRRTLAELGIPGYAQGTNYVPNTGLALLHEGEAVIPKAYNRGGGGTSEIVTELRALREQNARLEARLAGIEKSSAASAEILDNVTEGGNAMRSEVMA